MSDVLGSKKKLSSTEEYAIRQGEKEVRNWDKNMFSQDFLNADKEADNLIDRYKQETTLSEDEIDILKKNVPEAPKFKVLSKAAYEKKSCGKSSYRKKVKKYYEYRQKYYTTKPKEDKKGKKDGFLFASTKHKIEERIRLQKESEELLEKAKQEGYYDEFDETNDVNDLCEQMDSEFEKLAEDERYREVENKISQKEYEVYEKTDKDLGVGLRSWMNLNWITVQKALRYNERAADRLYSPLKNSMPKILKNRPLNRTMVVRCGLSGNDARDTIKYMLGIRGGNYTMDDVRELIEKKMQNKEQGLFLQDKGPFSTSLPGAKSAWGAGSDNEPFGIEFVVLAKKGTAAVHSEPWQVAKNLKEEREVTFPPGTKFKVLRVDFENAHFVHHEHGENAWKIYLETIPEEESKKGKED